MYTAPVAARDDEPSLDARFLDGLRERQLFRLAESYCQERLADPKLAPEARADLAVQLSQTYVQHARSVLQNEADPLWQAARQTIDDYAKANSTSPWLPVVEVQGSLVELARGELLRQLWELSGSAAIREEAKKHLGNAIDALPRHDAKISELLHPTRRQSADGPARHQLVALQRNLRYQLALGYRNRAQCYPDVPADRDDALRQAIDLFTPIAGLDVPDDIIWKSRLEVVRCHRLKGSADDAQRRLNQVEAADPPPPDDVRLKILAERIRIFAAAGDVSRALELAAPRPGLSGASPDLDLARLEAYLAAWQFQLDRKDDARASEMEAKSLGHVRFMRSTYDPYWSRQAEMLLARSSLGASQGGDIALLVRSADLALQNGQVEQALGIYDQAAASAAKNGKLDRAFELCYQAASVEHGRGNFAQSARRFRDLALAQRENSQAGDAHLLAIHSAAQEAQRHTPPQIDLYVELVNEHLQIWPKADSANHARWFLGRLLESRQEWEGAIESYGRIAPEHERFPSAIEAAAGCFESWIRALQDAQEDPTPLGRRAAQYFESVFVGGAQDAFPDRWSYPERLAALAAARFRMNYASRDYRRAVQILAAALERGPQPDQTWQARARAAQVAGYAGLDRMDDAERVLARLLADMTPPAAPGGAAPPLRGDPLLWLTLMEDVARAAKAAPRESLARIGVSQLRVAKALTPHRAEMAPYDRKRFDALVAEGTGLAGDIAKAAERYEVLVREYPRDGDILEDHVRLLVGASDRRLLEAGLDKARDLERKAKTASPRWFRAKYYMALAHVRLGNKAQAQKIINVTKVLHPDLGGPQMKARFLALLESQP
jgi:tetratricopeptide (TPR) repeat protein